MFQLIVYFPEYDFIGIISAGCLETHLDDKAKVTELKRSARLCGVAPAVFTDIIIIGEF